MESSSPPPAPFLLIYRSSARREAAAALALLTILAIFRLPVLAQISSSFIGGAQGDGGLYVWLVKSNLRDLLDQPWFNTYAFYPYAKSLAWSDNFIFPSALVGIFQTAGFSFVLAYNTVLLLANLLNGYCTYRLTYKLGGEFFGALFAGSLFMCFSNLAVHLGHPQLQFAFFLPLALCALFEYLAKPSFKAPVIIGIAVFLAFLSSVYFSLFTVAACGSVLLALIVLRPKHLKLPDYGRLFGGVLCGGAPLAFFIGPYLDVKETFGPRGLYESYYLAASTLSYLSTSLRNFLYRGWPLNNVSEENTLFPGLIVFGAALLAAHRVCFSKPVRKHALLFFLPFALALLFSARAFPITTGVQLALCALLLWLAGLGLLIFLRHLGRVEEKQGISFLTDRDILAICLASAFIFLAISFGPLGNPEKGQLALGPYAALHALVPGFDGLRAVSRAGIVSVFFLTITGGLFLARRLPRQARYYAYPILIGLGLFENLTTNLPLAPAPSVPSIFQKLEALIPPEEVVLILPLARSLDRNNRVKSWAEYAEINTTYMNWMQPLKRTVVNGYSGLKFKFMEDIPREFANFPDNRSVAALQKIAGLRWVVFIPELLSDFDEVAFRGRLEEVSQKLPLIENNGGAYLFNLVAPARIDDSFYLLAPSYPQGTLLLELLPVKSPTTLEVYLEQHVPGTPIQRIELSPSPSPRHLEIPLPKTKDSVRPLRITFKTKGEVFIQRSSFAPAGP